MRRERLVVLVTSRNGTPRSRSRASAVGGARNRRASRVQGAVEIEQEGGGSGRWHGCRVTVRYRLSCIQCPLEDTDMPVVHAARPRGRCSPAWPRPALPLRGRRDACSTTPSSACFPIGTATMTVNPMAREQGTRGVRLRRQRARAVRSGIRVGADLTSYVGTRRLQLAPLSPPAVPGQQRGRGALPDRPRLEPLSPGRRPAGLGGPARSARRAGLPVLSPHRPAQGRAPPIRSRATSRPATTRSRSGCVGRETVTLPDGGSGAGAACSRSRPAASP